MSIGRSVSLYSLQEPYFLGKMDLEACVAAVKKQVGADGIEVLVDQMPYPSLRSEERTMSDDDIAKFKDLMQKYQTVPTAYDTTFFTTWYAKRNMSNRETIYWTKKDMVNCARMGFPVYRTGIMRKEDIQILSECFGVACFSHPHYSTIFHAMTPLKKALHAFFVARSACLLIEFNMPCPSKPSSLQAFRSIHRYRTMFPARTACSGLLLQTAL